MRFIFENQEIELADPDLATGQSFEEAAARILSFMRCVFNGVSAQFSQGERYYCMTQLSKNMRRAISANIGVIEESKPQNPNPVFNDPQSIKNIVACAWEAEEDEHSDAIIRMQFEQDSNNLFLHVHEFSDRVLIVEEGCGFGYYAIADPEGFQSSDIKKVNIRPGTMIVFPRNTPHTFQCTDKSIKTITYHSPYIDFDNPQSTKKVIEVNKGWYPHMF